MVRVEHTALVYMRHFQAVAGVQKPEKEKKSHFTCFKSRIRVLFNRPRSADRSAERAHMDDCIIDRATRMG